MNSESIRSDDSYSDVILAKMQKKKRPKNQEFVGFKEKKKEFKQQKRKWEEEKAMNKIRKKMEAEQKAKEEEDLKKSQREKFGRSWTVSIALPGSIVENAQSDEEKTNLSGYIARAATVFCVDEIIVFDELKSITRNEDKEFVNLAVGKRRNGCIMLAKILQYLDCPQYLRKSLFPQQPDLKFAGALHPLNAPHHLRSDVWNDYREGVVRNIAVKDGKGSYVDIGLQKDCQIDKHLLPGVKVTVKIDPNSKEAKRKYIGEAVAPSAPRTEQGQYWGYKTRLVTCLSEVFSGCPYDGGYDITVGTSERGDNVDTYSFPSPFKHLLIVYLNTCPEQGSATIRTEEALWISLSALRPKISASQKSSAST
ncbi:C9orf114 [Bugula neritina]|uniref:C9orf114 n=1 Tax=Bugula neritina TaxID=10212 RepID=A0A7J7JEL7_BUGNE|nr:C9orf114 [Bugula neritina]